MIRPEKDLVNPPGQWVNPNVGKKIQHEKTLDKAIQEYLETQREIQDRINSGKNTT